MRDRGAAVPEFVLVLMVLLPLVLGLVQLGLVLHVRTTLTAAASEGARAGSSLGAGPREAEDRARHLIQTTLAERFAQDVSAEPVVIDGVPLMAVRVEAEVPALGVAGPAVPLSVSAHAVRQEEP
ncbi:TadE/TadG family type IV pilus assembly protein [uncultured Aeromicrobium sp.]|uniref:TadE/TadG family type IV pilus assembly protein n=1 Tax=uncultured Aeromicrobium sp. TaxID=337820 RepID=UPI0025DF69BA|nr:TadE/TadG family type IV pilus assembly protein [uncultured Aeromicrobium sp.]